MNESTFEVEVSKEEKEVFSKYVQMDPAQRVELLNLLRIFYCPACGYPQPTEGQSCHCENDE